MKKRTVAALLLSLLFFLSSCRLGDQNRFTVTWFDLFDTVVTVTAYDESQATFDEHSAALHEKLLSYHRLFDIYHTYHDLVNVRTLNREAKNGPVKVDDALFELLTFGKEAYALSSGKVNVCMGTVLSIWHLYRETAMEDPANAALPPGADLWEASKHTNINDLLLDKENKTVSFADPELQLDLGAVAKGYAAQKASEWAKANVWDAAILSLGGNVVAFGTNENDPHGLWNVGIENPDETAQAFLATVSVADRAVVTSGDYQRYFTVDGKRYCHIIDPATRQPGRFFSGVTVICSDSAMADALSTALFLLPEAEGKALVETMPETEALWARPDGTTVQSSGFDALIKQ